LRQTFVYLRLPPAGESQSLCGSIRTMNGKMTPYKRLTLVQLITAYQQTGISDSERESIEQEIVRRKIDLEEAKRMKVESLQQIAELKSIDRAVLKDRVQTMFWRIFWRVIGSIIVFIFVMYGLQFWSWLAK
jgi:ribosomal protein S10